MSTIANRQIVAVPPASAPPVEALVARVRAAWRRSVLLRAAVLAPALFAAAAVALVLIDLVFPLRAAAREVLRIIPFALLIGVMGHAAHRVLRPPSARRFALLAEERIPALENRLVTALDLGTAPQDGPVARAFLAEAARRLSTVDLAGVAPPRLKRPAVLLGGALAVITLFSLIFPTAAAEAWERWTDPRDAYESAWREARAEALPNVPTPPVPGFDELRWRVEPPAYSGLSATEGRGDEPIQALPGSRIRLRSRFADRWSGVAAARVGAGALPVRRAGGEWVVEWTAAADEKGVTLEARAGGETIDRRVVPVSLLPDQPPDVALTAPETDLVLARGAGQVPIRASASDDYGVGGLRLGWSRTRGSGETFEFTEGEWSFGRLEGGGRSVSAELVVDLARLELQPGDVLHVRAVARDRNDVTGPGESVSRTRIIRVARPDELDQVNTDISFPTELPEDPVLSQRMLIIRTERLRDRMPRLAAQEGRTQSAEIGHQQNRLRERVGEQIFIRAAEAMQNPDEPVSFTEEGGVGGHAHGGEGERHAEGGQQTPEEVLEAAEAATGRGTEAEITHRHDEAPIIDVNRTLMTIFNLMWAAERELNQGAPAAALPHQYQALKLIQEMQRAERRFPRGLVKVDPVDVAAARGEGKIDEASPAGRTAGAELPSALPLLAELDRAAGALGRRPARQASLELSGLAARILASPAGDREAAALVSRAANEAGAGKTDAARDLLRRARARLSPAGGPAARPLPSSADPAAAEYFRRLGRGR